MGGTDRRHHGGCSLPSGLERQLRQLRQWRTGAEPSRLVCFPTGYKLDWGTPGIYGWYFSGDDGNPRNGSERLPSFNYNNESTSGFSGFGTLGTWIIGRDAVLGYTLAGTWGFGARIRDLSFMDKLSHTIRVNIYNGTNAPRMARYIKGELDVPGRTGFSYGTDFYALNTNGGIYLMQKDYAAEFGLMSSYQIYAQSAPAGGSQLYRPVAGSVLQCLGMLPQERNLYSSQFP